MSSFDALDRVGEIHDSILGDTLIFGYDSLDSVMSISDEAGSEGSVSYSYDSNGRRIGMAPPWQAAFSYGYGAPLFPAHWLYQPGP